MSLTRLQTATAILNTHAHPHAARGHEFGPGAARLPAQLSLGAPTVDQCLEGGLACGGLHEVRCVLARDMGAAAGFALGLVARAVAAQRGGRGAVLWVRDPAARGDGGGLFPAGLAQYGLDPSRLTFVEPRDLRGAMWAADEAAGCAALTALVFQLKGNPPRFDITATRRLMLRARESGVLVLTLRQSGEEEASAAVTRWGVRTEISAAQTFHHRGVGAMRLSLTLERNRAGRTGQWLLAWNPTTRAFEHAIPHATSRTPSAHALHCLSASANRRDLPDTMGKVLDHRQDFGRAS